MTLGTSFVLDLRDEKPDAPAKARPRRRCADARCHDTRGIPAARTGERGGGEGRVIVEDGTLTVFEEG